MTVPAPGMDHGHYLYSALPDRPRLLWPNGARLAVSVYLHLEYYEMEQGPTTIRDSRYNSRSAPDVLHHSWFEYGNRIGIFRILDALTAHGMRITVPTNAVAAERNPRLVRDLADLGAEFVAHGLTATEMQHSHMSEAEEARLIATSASRLEAATGQRPRGWMSQDFGNSIRTPRLIAEAGFDYCADWANDEQPYWMTYDRLVSVPNHVLFDDVFTIWDRHVPMVHYPDIIASGARQLAEDGVTTGRFMSIGLRPWVMGASHRIKYLEMALAELAAIPGLWFATAGEVAAHYAAVTAYPAERTREPTPA
ncbi:MULTISPECIES: polysaccharide deacetylase family protein [unclassified Chelatococcus]|jgi:allantoinase|uniref:polysaccharide deacetylase family protein n=1 Tax=unclassified Chelatococcus TaxID=2638111 RepID=UPI001BCB57BF|nr:MULTISPECIES: polysaccharide deacetylase family protein [unclassified Chelatococcus]CAH1649242.1 Chitooligosaccharide deacetylase [Hyphomicrobiales bacterium]MBS7741791.1 polysaccharide deacetylase family protein [Chelatococcus sp. HY11]MBX3541411.1 polysaccharide deacetylase family protein [Chelatococcus sp.]MCO5074695.1 polysaccharide deacetylase family protein [Chelatococcus sp.]CAH1691808.1 Chitooligosaccharide deacetylase [Hyphomicrobiales bacterium]